uniref:Inner capsid protein VP2 n=1 Tax=Rotavirus C (strain RVC/Pig/United States/Cowden/1980) TaxID=10916 RepID=VP2_ROTPC|nr:RecName: Full=Inner capsid protein VP2 [Porcine rotavirus C strain Cowden]AAA19561.1 major internal core protein [Porcine rotavirus C]
MISRNRRRNTQQKDAEKEKQTENVEEKEIKEAKEQVKDEKQVITEENVDSPKDVKEQSNTVNLQKNDLVKEVINIQNQTLNTIVAENKVEIEEVVKKYIPSYSTDKLIVKNYRNSRIKCQTYNKLFRLLHVKSYLYDVNGEKKLSTRWYWKLLKDDLPAGDYSVRQFFLSLYLNVLDEMPDYVMLRDMAVDNPYSAEAGKIVDEKSKEILVEIYQDQMTEGYIRRYMSDLRHRISGETNTAKYPAILHPVDEELNKYFLEHQLIQPLTTRNIAELIPTQLYHDPNYVFNIDAAFLTNSRFVPPYLTQDRIGLHDGFESIWDAKTHADYVSARRFVPDLTELVDAEKQMKEMLQCKLNHNSWQELVHGRNEAFKFIIGTVLSTRTIAVEFITSNYMSLASCMYLMTIMPSEIFLRESLVAMQLAVINTLIYPALGLAQMHYQAGEIRRLELAEMQVANRPIRQWLHHCNTLQFGRQVTEGVTHLRFTNDIMTGRIVNLFSTMLVALSSQPFATYPLDYKRSVQRALQLLSNRTAQIADLTRLIVYNYTTLSACIVMNMHLVGTLTVERIQATALTSLIMLISNKTVIPEPSSLFSYFSSNINFLTNYNEQIDNVVAEIMAAYRLDLYQQKMLMLVTRFVSRLYIFDAPKIPPDQMYRLRNRLRNIPVERRRADVFRIIMNNRDLIEKTSERICQGVLLSYSPMPLTYVEDVGLTNVVNDTNGFQIINIEEIEKTGDYSAITNALLRDTPIILKGAIPYVTNSSVIDVLSKIDTTVFASIVKDRDISKLKPIKFTINSDSSEYYLVHNNKWTPTTTTAVYKARSQQFNIQHSVSMLESNLFFVVYNDLFKYIKTTTVLPINAVSYDGARIMQET